MNARIGGVAKGLVAAAATLRDQVDTLTFSRPVTHVYNPLRYAWTAHRKYLLRVGDQSARVLLLGMNPGPWGMAQTGVPFGEVSIVRDWLGIDVPVDRPSNEHPKRPVEGFACSRSEVSGRRLWGLFRERFGTADAFLAEHFVVNYCPLVFMEESARNRTPDKLPLEERKPLDQICDNHLVAVIKTLQPEFLVGVGAYAEKCLQRVAEGIGSTAVVSRILHPSPASPAANKDWSASATAQLEDAGIW